MSYRVDPSRIDAGDIQRMYDRAVAGADRASAALALEALEHGMGADAWVRCELVLAPRTVRTLTHEGKSLSVREWSMLTGIPRDAINSRLKLGWSTERALTEPVRRLAA